jgi:hypothetical protein
MIKMSICCGMLRSASVGILGSFGSFRSGSLNLGALMAGFLMPVSFLTGLFSWMTGGERRCTISFNCPHVTSRATRAITSRSLSRPRSAMRHCRQSTSRSKKIEPLS